MGGGLMQLVAYGAQDIYLTGNPQITFFKVVYRRHTNFSMESIQQTLAGTVCRKLFGLHQLYQEMVIYFKNVFCFTLNAGSSTKACSK